MRGGSWKAFWIVLFLVAYALVLSQAWNHPETHQLPIYALFSISRLIITYIICLAFGLILGIIAAMNDTVGDIVIPLLDIGQSVPVLAVFPFAIFFIVPLFGINVATIVALFMSMAWSIVFGVIAGVKSIPQSTQDMAAIFGIKKMDYIKHIVLPSIYPPLIAGSILAFGSGWYFIIASEYITYGTTTYTAPGLGYYLNIASFQYADIWMSLAGFMTIAFIVLVLHFLVWKKLDRNAREAKFLNLHFGYSATDTVENPEHYDKPQHETRAHPHRRVQFSRRHAHQWFFNIFTFNATTYLFALIAALAAGFLISWKMDTQILYRPVELFGLLLSSMARILLAYIFALLITIFVGYLLIRKPATRYFLMPLADVLQSIPAIAYFPTFYLIFTLAFQGFGLQIASVLLLMTGMLWYLLFNMIEAVEHLPHNLNDISAMYHIKGKKYVTDVLIPAMFPALITGSILAVGGGWNAIMVSEYVNIGGVVHSIPGLGSAMDYAAINAANTPTLLMIIFIMTATVLLLNHFVWRRLLNRASKYVLEEE